MSVSNMARSVEHLIADTMLFQQKKFKNLEHLMPNEITLMLR